MDTINTISLNLEKFVTLSEIEVNFSEEFAYKKSLYALFVCKRLRNFVISLGVLVIQMYWIGIHILFRSIKHNITPSVGEVYNHPL